MSIDPNKQILPHMEHEGASTEQKINWDDEPELFFLLFSSLYELGFINTKKGNNDLQAVSALLYKTFKVRKKIGQRDEYSEMSFIQNMKKTAIVQTDVLENVQLRERIIEFLKTLKET
jgi:hypothetical protein